MKNERHIIKAGKHTYNMSQEIPEAEQGWRYHLALVLFGAEKLLGVIPHLEAARTGKPFILYGALSYEGAQVQATPQGVKLVHPPIVIPFDTFGPATIHVSHASYVVLLKDQNQDWPQNNWGYLYDSYQATFAPPSVIRPDSGPGAGKIIV